MVLPFFSLRVLQERHTESMMTFSFFSPLQKKKKEKETKQKQGTKKKKKLNDARWRCQDIPKGNSDRHRPPYQQPWLSLMCYTQPTKIIDSKLLSFFSFWLNRL
jgi:hypothetical protein